MPTTPMAPIYRNDEVLIEVHSHGVCRNDELLTEVHFHGVYRNGEVLTEMTRY